MNRNFERIRSYSMKTYPQMTRKPDGILHHAFIVPGSQSYSNCLWDWDSWLTNVAVRQIMRDNHLSDPQFALCEKGCILNFLEHTSAAGRMPITITPESEFPEPETRKQTNIHKPCLAQHAAFVIRENGADAAWLRPHFHKLEAFIRYYQKNQWDEKTGLYYWIDDLAIGVDNDPCTFYRPDRSSASVYLNCLMYRELLAMGYIAERLGEAPQSYQKAAAQLKESINRQMWDERNGFYYSVDLNLRPIDPTVWLHSGMPRHWDGLIQRIDCWSGFMALWAGIAEEDQAKRVIEENMMSQRLFSCNAGIRTLAQTEKMYRLVKSGNPSCWLGPVWGISNYVCFRGLIRYGYRNEAELLAEKTIDMFDRDLKEHGMLHEYYHPETCEGMNNPGFQNWNLLVNNMAAEIDGRETVLEF